MPSYSSGRPLPSPAAPILPFLVVPVSMTSLHSSTSTLTPHSLDRTRALPRATASATVVVVVLSHIFMVRPRGIDMPA